MVPQIMPRKDESMKGAIGSRVHTSLVFGNYLSRQEYYQTQADGNETTHA